jgi:hypothetical protein
MPRSTPDRALTGTQDRRLVASPRASIVTARGLSTLVLTEAVVQAGAKAVVRMEGTVTGGNESRWTVDPADRPVLGTVLPDVSNVVVEEGAIR